jgi:hypothetical protein
MKFPRSSSVVPNLCVLCVLLRSILLVVYPGCLGLRHYQTLPVPYCPTASILRPIFPISQGPVTHQDEGANLAVCREPAFLPENSQLDIQSGCVCRDTGSGHIIADQLSARRIVGVHPINDIAGLFVVINPMGPVKGIDTDQTPTPIGRTIRQTMRGGPRLRRIIRAARPCAIGGYIDDA